MVAQVLIVVDCDDGRELLQRILRILTEEDGWFFGDRDITLPWPSGVAVFFILVFNSTTDLGATLGFLARRSVFSDGFLLVDGLAIPIPLRF